MFRRSHLDDVATVSVTKDGQSFGTGERVSATTPEDDHMCVTLSSIAITPSNQTVNINTTQQFSATGTWSDGSTMNLTSAVTWASGNSSALTITNGTLGGLAAAFESASVSITATLLGVTGQTTVTIPASSLASAHYQVPTSFGSYGTPQTFVIQPFIPDDVTQVRIRMRNMTYDAGVDRGDVTGVSIGIGTSDGNFNYSGSPTVYSGVTIPGASDYVSAWTTVARGSDGRIVIAYTVPASTTVAQTIGNNYKAMVVSGTAQVNPIPAGTPGTEGTLCYYLCLEMQTSKRKVVIIGDSIVAGYTTYFDRPGLGECYGYGLAIDHSRYSVDAHGINGSQLNSYADTSGHAWMTYSQNFLDAYVVIEAGVNDLPVKTLSDYQANIAAMISFLQTAGARKIIWQTIMPQTVYAGVDTLRQQVNSYINSGVSGIDAVFDASTIMQNPADHTVLNPPWDADGIHPNITGHGILESNLFTLLETLP